MVRLHFALLCLYTMNPLSDFALENRVYQFVNTAAKPALSSPCLCNKRCLHVSQLRHLGRATSFKKVSGGVQILVMHTKTALKEKHLTHLVQLG